MRFTIDVANKIAVPLNPPEIICGNSDYVIDFTFDDEWNDYNVKTARFTFKLNGQNVYKEVLFTGTECKMPILSNITEVYVGVYAGELSTTTPAKLICKKSILCSSSMHKEPNEDIYIQILNLLQNNYPVENAIKLAQELEKLEDFKTSIELIVQEYPATSMYMKRLYDEMTAKLSGDIIWTNTDETASFEAQTIELNLTEYKRFEILWRVGTQYERYYQTAIRRKNAEFCNTIDDASITTTTFGYRRCTFTDTGVVFDAAMWTAPNTASIAFLLKLSVISIKGET